MLPDTTTPETYGLPKSNADDIANEETDLSFEEYESLSVDVASMTHTCPRAIAHVDAGASPSLVSHSAVWGDTDGVAPTLTRTGAGEYTLTWAASYEDLNPTPDRKSSRVLDFRFAEGQIAESTTGFISVTWTANTISVLTYNAVGAAADRDFVVVVY